MGAKEQLFIDAMYETKYTENTKEKTQHGIQNHDLTQLHGNWKLSHISHTKSPCLNDCAENDD